MKTKKRGRSKAGNKEVRKAKMREQAMRDSGHLESKKKEQGKGWKKSNFIENSAFNPKTAEKFKKQKAKDVLARFMKRDI